jgi:hypothetical protein
MRQGEDTYSDVQDANMPPRIIRTREIKVTLAKVNEPLPQEWFVWQFVEGVKVMDRRSDPELNYKYKKHFEPAEWQAIVDEAAHVRAQRHPGSDDPQLRLELELREKREIGRKRASTTPATAEHLR